MGAAAIIIIIAAALLATVSVRAGWYLTLRGGENGETCVRYRLDEGDWFCVGFIHSVHKNPLIDCYQIQEHKIYVEQTYYYSFGAGVQSQLNEGESMTLGEDGSIVVSNIHKDFETIPLQYIVGSRSDHTLILGDIREDIIGAVEQGASKLEDYIIVAISSEGTVRNGPGDTIKMELASILKGETPMPYVSIWWYKLDSIDEVARPEMWLKANPNLGKTVTYETYQRDVDKMEIAPANRNDILAKRFGIPMEGYTYYFTYKCRAAWEPTFLRATTSAPSRFCSPWPAALSG